MSTPPNDRAEHASECGICHDSLAEERGVIDSCDHAFCHPCISKWSSIESRCPFCRERFSVIRKVGTDGVVVTEEVVPVRDQRAIFENRDFIDWLESVRCMVCNGADAEDQLMLCDGCDQACHTFCVGLSSVPDDAWFCEQCEAARPAAGIAAAVPAIDATETDSPIGRTRRRATRRIRSRRTMRIDTESESDLDTEGDASDVEEVPETSAPSRRRPRMLILDTDSDEERMLNSIERPSSVVDLTSPLRSVSPHLLDLRSRLRAQLLSSGGGWSLPTSNGEMGSIDMIASTNSVSGNNPGCNPHHATPRSPMPRSALGFATATTVSDLTFATNVAAGRRTTTPMPRNSSGRREGRQTFAQRAQALARERLSLDFCAFGGRTMTIDAATATTRATGATGAINGTGAVIIDLRDSRDSGLERGDNRTSGPSPRHNQQNLDPNERARALQRVKARMDEKFAGITLPPSMVAAVQDIAANLLVADVARWSVGTDHVGRPQLVDDAIDEALTTFNRGL